MQDRADHWDHIFQSKRDAELGWFEKDMEQTLKFVRQASPSKGASFFLPGAGTSTLVDKLYAMGHRLVLNDVSEEALKQVKSRLGGDGIEYQVADISQSFEKRYEVDFWLDRAVLHFLLTETEISGYFDNLRQSVKPGGYVLLAEFAKGGASKCAGLELTQYDITDMQARLGDDFSLIASENYTFINPFEQPRPYIYGLFRRGQSCKN
mgnify:CR=1 FL=1